MRKRKTALALIILIVLIIAGYLIFKSNNKTIVLKAEKTEEYLVLKEILEDSKYFNESTYNYDKENKIFTIDDKYSINIKNGYYTMDIINNKNDDTYCKIVDAVQMKLGAERGASIETCKMVLDGKINASGINVSSYENHKTLNVNNRELANLYSESSARSDEEEISLDELNYTINIDDYIFSSLNGSYDSELKIYNICGNIYGEDKNKKEFVFILEDENKASISQEKYEYIKEDNYSPFCIEFKDVNVEPKYYKVHLDN